MHFRPEFINRIDEIVSFKRLGRGEIDHIVDIQDGRLEHSPGRRADEARSPASMPRKLVSRTRL